MLIEEKLKSPREMFSVEFKKNNRAPNNETFRCHNDDDDAGRYCQKQAVIIPSVTRFGGIFGNFFRVHLVFGKILYLRWQMFYATGKIFIVVNGQIEENNLAIWSH